MKNALVRTRRQQRGIYIVMTALVLVVLLGFVGLAIDSSRQQSVHVELQNAADACALAVCGSRADSKFGLASTVNAEKNPACG